MTSCTVKTSQEPQSDSDFCNHSGPLPQTYSADPTTHEPTSLTQSWLRKACIQHIRLCKKQLYLYSQDYLFKSVKWSISSKTLV